MVSVLPSRVMNYRVSDASPSDELITLGQILAEVGDHACTILDSEHLSLTRKCAARLKKVVAELITRHSIKSQDELYEIPAVQVEATDLSVMTIAELHNLYRCWPLRHKNRAAEGREHMTFYYERQIVSELQSRQATTKDEQLKIDYCIATYRNEMENLSFFFSCPIQVNDNKIYPDKNKTYSPDELAELIVKYSNYRDLIEREILIEYVDYALDFLEREGRNMASRPLLSEIDELGRKEIIKIPRRVNLWLENPA